MAAARYIPNGGAYWFPAECDGCHRWISTTGPFGGPSFNFRFCARCIMEWEASYGAQHLPDEEE